MIFLIQMKVGFLINYLQINQNKPIKSIIILELFDFLNLIKAQIILLKDYLKDLMLKDFLIQEFVKEYS